MKRNRDRSRIWLAGVLLVACTMSSLGFFYLQLWREPVFVALRYGDLVQTLRASSHGTHLSLQKVQLGHSDVRGEIVSTDRVSTGGEEKTHTQTVPFRTLRTGFERDQELYGLLRESVGAGYQGAEEDSALRTLGNLMMTFFFLAMLGVGLLLMLRWMSGGGSPFTFGRSRARLYAQKDLEATFDDVAGIDEAVAELREVVDFLSARRNTTRWAGAFPRGCCWSVRRGRGKRCWRGPSRGRRKYRSSAFRGRISWKCLSASALPGA